MFTTAQIVGLAVCVLVVLAIALVLMRVDNAIVSSLATEEDAETAADTSSAAASVPGSAAAATGATGATAATAAAVAATHRPKTPAGGKNLSRSQRKRHKR